MPASQLFLGWLRTCLFGLSRQLLAVARDQRRQPASLIAQLNSCPFGLQASEKESWRWLAGLPGLVMDASSVVLSANLIQK